MIAARLLDLGLQPYRRTWELQHALHDSVRKGEQPETWIFVEHEPVVTLGRNANVSNVLLSQTALHARGVDLVHVERGGDVTYHGPGQLVVYPIRRLERFREIVPLVRALEGVAIEVCARFGVRAQRWSDHAGVWVGAKQICALGLAVQKMTYLHGIALNICTDLSYDTLINPCGLPDRGITSLSRETGCQLSLAQVKPVMRSAIERALGVEFESCNVTAKAS